MYKNSNIQMHILNNGKTTSKTITKTESPGRFYEGENIKLSLFVSSSV